MISPLPNPVYDIHNPLGLRLLTRIKLRLSHLNEHKFNYNFKNCVNPLLTCILEIESTSHFFLHCIHYNNISSTLLNDIYLFIWWEYSKVFRYQFTNLILCGGSPFNIKQNTFTLNAVIKYILESNRFMGRWFKNNGSFILIMSYLSLNHFIY